MYNVHAWHVHVRTNIYIHEGIRVKYCVTYHELMNMCIHDVHVHVHVKLLTGSGSCSLSLEILRHLIDIQ